MNKSKSLMDRVTVGFQCPMNWEAMAGEGTERFCAKCRKSVTDLSALTSAEAERFVREEGKGACIRLQRREDGSLVTKGCPQTVAGKAKAARAVLGGGAAALVLVSCGSDPDCGGAIVAPGPKGGVERPILMGVMCVPGEDD
ncbi:MAG: hypothetical protein O3A92_15875 [Verrucomicrobia bacterium]|nr:hypothetical protein [Verrucomicrobiota bacterium]